MDNPATVAHELVELFANGPFGAKGEPPVVALPNVRNQFPEKCGDDDAGDRQCRNPEARNGTHSRLCTGTGQVTKPQRRGETNQPEDDFADLVIEKFHLPSARFTRRT